MPDKKLLKGPKGNFLFGSTLSYAKDPIAFLDQQVKMYGGISKFRFTTRDLIVLHEPESIQHVLQKNHSNYRKNIAYRKLKLLLGNGLFTNEGQSWLTQRRLIQPAFLRESLKSYEATMTLYADKYVSLLERNSGIRDLNRDMVDVTLSIVSKCLLDIEADDKSSKIVKHLPPALDFMIKRILNPTALPIEIPLPSHVHFKKNVKALEALIQECIDQKRKNLGLDLLSVLIETKDEDTGQGMDDIQLRDEVLTLFLAGHETSASALTWTLYLLAENPDIQEKIKAEIEATKSWREQDYLEAVLNESMRLIPPIWILGRQAIEPDIISGVKIDKDASLIFSPYLIHRDSKYWENAEQFDPERFYGKKLNDFKGRYFPFGAGPRMCVGNHFAMMEMKIILRKLIQNFTFEVTDKTKAEYAYSLTLRPKYGMQLNIKKR